MLNCIWASGTSSSSIIFSTGKKALLPPPLYPSTTPLRYAPKFGVKNRHRLRSQEGEHSHMADSGNVDSSPAVPARRRLLRTHKFYWYHSCFMTLTTYLQVPLVALRQAPPMQGCSAVKIQYPGAFIYFITNKPLDSRELLSALLDKLKQTGAAPERTRVDIQCDKAKVFPMLVTKKIQVLYNL